MKQENILGRILNIITKWNIAIFLFLFFVQFILYLFGMEFRSWIDLLRAMQIIFLLPINLAIAVSAKMHHKAKEATSIATERFANLITAFTCLFTVMFVLLSAFVFLMIGDGKIETETFLGKNLIKGEKYEILGGLESTIYSQSILGIFKKPYEDKGEAVLEVMQATYGKKMEIIGIAEVFSGWPVYKLRDINGGFVFGARYKDEFGIEDDYYPSFACNILQKELNLSDRKVFPYYNETSGLCESPMMECLSYEDAKDAAQDVLTAAKILAETSYFGKDGNGYCTIKIYNKDAINQNNNSISIYVFQGEIEQIDEEQMRIALQQQFVPGDKTDGTKEEYKEPQEDKFVSAEADEIEGSPEWAYQKLYNKVLKTQGAEYNTNYNAKGNFYSVLYQKDGKLNQESEEMLIEGTVVYNGVTKNGKCHEFVQYDTYYTDEKERQEYTTAILEFYAVDKITGKVYIADKHAWADLPTKEYKNATEGDGS